MFATDPNDDYSSLGEDERYKYKLIFCMSLCMTLFSLSLFFFLLGSRNEKVRTMERNLNIF